MDFEVRCIPIDQAELRVQRSDGSVGIRGLGIPFDVRADIGPFYEEIDSRALDDLLAENPDILSLYNHDRNMMLGRTSSGTMKVSKTERGIEYEIPSLPKTRADVAELIERGDIKGSSWGFAVPRDGSGEKWSRLPDGKELRRVTRIALLRDISPVAEPAYGNDTSVALRSRDAALGPDVRAPSEVVAEIQAMKDKVSVIEAEL